MKCLLKMNNRVIHKLYKLNKSLYIFTVLYHYDIVCLLTENGHLNLLQSVTLKYKLTIGLR